MESSRWQRLTLNSPRELRGQQVQRFSLVFNDYITQAMHSPCGWVAARYGSVAQHQRPNLVLESQVPWHIDSCSTRNRAWYKQDPRGCISDFDPLWKTVIDGAIYIRTQLLAAVTPHLIRSHKYAGAGSCVACPEIFLLVISYLHWQTYQLHTWPRGKKRLALG